MSKDYYKISEVVFGLRNEYLRIGKKLQELNQYAELNTQRFKFLNEDLRFQINNGDLGYYFSSSRDDCYLVNLYSDLRKENNSYLSDDTLEIIDIDNFNALATDILNDDFSKNIDLSVEFNNCDDNNQVVKINVNSGYIRIWLDNMSKLKKSMNMIYCAPGTRFCCPKGDIIWINKKRRLVMRNNIDEFLAISVPKDMLSNYHRNVIDRSDNNKYLELLMRKGFMASGNFEIIDDSNKVVLKKVYSPYGINSI